MAEFDRKIILNDNDRHLTPIKIDLLELIQRTYKDYGYPVPQRFPQLKDIAGYKLSKHQQMFQRETYPQRLRDLEMEIRGNYNADKTGIDRKEQMIINDFWDQLNLRQDDYQEEIEWIKMVWYHRLFGYWFYCNGKPTYITGVHYFYLNWWWLDDVRPDYRDSDRRWWIGQKWLQYDTYTFRDIDKETGLPIRNRKGEYDMVDTGRKLWVGSNNPKSRRVGHTSKAECDNTEFATRTIEAHIGIQGKDEDNAENVFKNHFLRPYKKLPIIFKPLSAQVSPNEIMLFESDGMIEGLNTRVDYATTKHRSAYDGYKLKRLHTDEPGKVIGESVNKRHAVVRQCLALGSGADIIGFSQYTTTVDEMDREGAQQYLELSNGSHWEKRNPNGQTATGLCNIFMRASDGLHGFIDRFGQSIEDDPTPEQAKYIGRSYGAKKYIENERMQFVRENRLSDLIEHKRQFPMNWAEVFTPPAKNTFFRLDIIEKRIEQLRHELEPPRRGNFYHLTPDPDSDVFFREEHDGKFFMSKTFLPSETNRRTRSGGTFMPLNTDKYVASADTFKLEKTEGSKMSNGAGAVREKHDPLVDKPDKDISTWTTARLVITYNNRPTTLEEYCEDMLMMCIYTGALMYPEQNIDEVEKHFVRRGYAGYLLYDMDWKTGRLKTKPGFFSTIDVKKKIFNLIANNIALHGSRCMHADYLEECMQIKGLDDMTRFDLFTAVGGTLLAEDSSYRSHVVEETDTEDFITAHEF